MTNWPASASREITLLSNLLNPRPCQCNRIDGSHRDPGWLVARTLVAMRALPTVLSLLLLQYASALLLPRASALRARAPRMDTQWSSPSYSAASGGAVPTPAELCAALQNGEAEVVGLDEVLSGTKTARPFFDVYLTGDEWTCADAAKLPRALAASIADAPAPVQEALLFNVVASAASETPDARRAARATLLINGLWDDVLPLRLSCIALKDSVATKVGAAAEKTIEDAGGGDMELIRAQWLTLLEFAGYSSAQFERIHEGLGKCGGSGDSFAADAPEDADG